MAGLIGSGIQQQQQAMQALDTAAQHEQQINAEDQQAKIAKQQSQYQMIGTGIGIASMLMSAAAFMV